MTKANETIIFRPTYPRMAQRIKRLTRRRDDNVYDVWSTDGSCYKRTGRLKRKFRDRIIGHRGRWFKVRYGGKITAGPFRTREEAARARHGNGTSNPKTRRQTRKYYGVRRGYGDDLYSWAVYDKRTGRTVLDGESRQQAGFIADRMEKAARAEETKL